MYGWLPLKKYKIQKGAFAAALSLCVMASLFFASCKTPPVPRDDFDFFTLFDADADLYLYIPVAGNESFVHTLIQSWPVGHASESQTDELLKRTASVYAAVFTDKRRKSTHPADIQLVLCGNYPEFFFNAALTQKRGWQSVSEADDHMLYKRKKNAHNFEVAVAGGTVLFVSNRNVFSMQKKYAQYRISGIPSVNWPVLNMNGGIPVRSLMYSDEKACIYIPQAGVLLPKMAGSPLELAIDYAVGTVQPYKDDQVIVHVKLQMSDERALKIAEKLFRFAVLGTSIVAKRGEGTVLILENLVIAPPRLAGFQVKK